MSLPSISITQKINQNVIVLIVGLLTLGIAEMYGLSTLYWIGLVISYVMAVSVLCSMVWYTWDYIFK